MATFNCPKLYMKLSKHPKIVGVWPIPIYIIYARAV